MDKQNQKKGQKPQARTEAGTKASKKAATALTEEELKKVSGGTLRKQDA